MSAEGSPTGAPRHRARIAVLGAGTVGAALLRLLARRGGADVRAVLVRDAERDRDVGPWKGRLTTDADAALDGVDVAVELIGGVERATLLMARAAERGARLVTANKAALAEAWSTWGPWAREGRVGLEAAVMAGTPVVGPLAGALRGSRPLELHALLNGTCAYVIDALERGREFEEALAEAQRLGYAEADPTLDVDGTDAAHKLALLARLAFDPAFGWEALTGATTGIRGLDGREVRAALRRGRRARLVASIWAGTDGWRAAVRPVALPEAHPLVALGGGRNALLFRGDAVGEVLIAGPGAGADATASAVLADLEDALAGRPGPLPLGAAAPLPAERHAGDPLEPW